MSKVRRHIREQRRHRVPKVREKNRRMLNQLFVHMYKLVECAMKYWLASVPPHPNTIAATTTSTFYFPHQAD